MATIVLVEDDPSLRHILQVYLAREGHTVLGAASADAGFDLVAEHEPDVLITDIVLGGENGIELARRVIASKRRRPRPRIIISSALFANPQMQHERTSEFGGFLQRPFEMHALVGAVSRLLERRAVIIHDDDGVYGFFQRFFEQHIKCPLDRYGVDKLFAEQIMPTRSWRLAIIRGSLVERNPRILDELRLRADATMIVTGGDGSEFEMFRPKIDEILLFPPDINLAIAMIDQYIPPKLSET